MGEDIFTVLLKWSFLVGVGDVLKARLVFQ